MVRLAGGALIIEVLDDRNVALGIALHWPVDVVEDLLDTEAVLQLSAAAEKRQTGHGQAACAERRGASEEAASRQGRVSSPVSCWFCCRSCIREVRSAREISPTWTA